MGGGGGYPYVQIKKRIEAPLQGDGALLQPRGLGLAGQGMNSLRSVPYSPAGRGAYVSSGQV